MKISAQVKANAGTEKIERINNNEFIIRVRAPAKEGKANQAVVEVLSEYFGIPKSRITILKGHSARNKIIEIA